jgi:hypothetical protein
MQLHVRVPAGGEEGIRQLRLMLRQQQHARQPERIVSADEMPGLG